MRLASKVSTVAALCLGFIGDPALGLAKDLYIAQSAAGLANGQDCSNTLDMSHFNTASYWVNANPVGTQIGPGTTVHLCGTFNASAGASGFLTFHGSGTSGDPITLRFEPGAALQAGYWGKGGAIASTGQSYIIIDGGTNGLIQATANGTAQANQNDGVGIALSKCNNCEVRNLTIANMYVHTSDLTDSLGGGTVAIQYADGNNVAIHDNTIHDANICALYGFSKPNANVAIYGNTIYNCNGSIIVGSTLTGATISGVSIRRNTIHDSVNWDDTADNNHHDGIHVWAVHDGSSWANVQICNNYIYGDWGIHTTGLVFIEANGGGSGSGFNAIYNNVLSQTNAASHVAANGAISLQGDGWYILNNAFINDSNAGGGGGAVQADSGNGVTMENNVLISPSTALNFPAGTSISAGDFNDYFNVGKTISYYIGGNTYNTLADLTAATGLDKHSIASNPNLSSTGVPFSGSVLIGAGANLTSLCGTFTSLCVDAAGVARPAAGAWDIGAYQFGGVRQALAPPAGVNVTVQ